MSWLAAATEIQRVLQVAADSQDGRYVAGRTPVQQVDRAAVTEPARCAATPDSLLRYDGTATPPLILPCDEVAFITNQGLQTKLDQGVVAAMQHPTVTIKFVKQFAKMFFAEAAFTDTPRIADSAAPTDAAGMAHR